MRRIFVTAAVALFFIAANTAAQLVNGGFETPANGGNLTEMRSAITGWQTIVGSQFKIARPNVNTSLAASAFGTSAAADSGQFLVLDHNSTGVLYRTVSTNGGDKLSWSLSHKGRHGTGHIEVWIGTEAEVVTRAAAQYSAVSGQHNVSRVDQNLRARIKQLWSGTDHPTERCDKEIITEHNVVSPNNGWVRYWGEYTVPIGQTETVIAFVSVSGNNLLDAVGFGQGDPAGTYRVTVRPSVGGHSVVEYGGVEFSTADNNTVVVEPKKGEQVTVNIHVVDNEGYIRRGAIVRRGDSEEPNGAYIMPFPAEAEANALITSVVYTAGSGALNGDIDITPVFSKGLSVIVNPIGGSYSEAAPLTGDIFTFTGESDVREYVLGKAERPGYRFTGWKVVGTNRYDAGDVNATEADGTMLGAGDKIKLNIGYLVAVDKGGVLDDNDDGYGNKKIAHNFNGFNLQAIYELIPVQPLTITLNPGTGGIYRGRPEPLSEVGSSPLTISMDAGNTEYTLAKPVRPGYEFVGWTLGAADIGETPIIRYADYIGADAAAPRYSTSGAVTGASPVVPPEGITLSARWSTQKTADLALEYEYRYQVRQCSGAFTNDSAQIPIFNGQTLHLPSQKFGYDRMTARQKITVTNAGSSQTGTLNIIRSGYDMAMFEIVNQAGAVIPSSIPSLTADQSAMFFIRPTAAATDARVYNAELTVTDGAAFTIKINIVFEVEARRVTISGLKVYDKYFDGTVKGWINTSAAVIIDADTKTPVSDPNLEINTSSAAAEFRDKIAGTVDTNILISGITLGGSAAGNYSLAGVQERMRAEITPRPIIGVTRNAGPPEKVYNGDREVSVVNGDYTFEYALKHWEIETKFTPVGGDALVRNTDYSIELFFDPVDDLINGVKRGNSAYVGDNLSFTYSVAFVDVTDRTKNYTLAGFDGSGTGGKITKSENFRADPVTVIVEKGRVDEPITYHLTQDLTVDRLFIIYHYGESTGPRTFHGVGSSKFNWSPGDNVLADMPVLTNLSDSTITYTGNGQSSGVTTMTLTVESHNYVDIPAVIRFQATDLLPMDIDDIKFVGRSEVYDGNWYTLKPAEMENLPKYGFDDSEEFKYEYSTCGRHWWHDGWNDSHGARINHGFDNVTVLVTSGTHYGQKRVRHSISRRTPHLDYFDYNIPARIYNESARSIENAVFKSNIKITPPNEGDGVFLRDSVLTNMGTPRVHYNGSRVPPTNAGEYTISFPVTLGGNFTSATLTPADAPNPPTPEHADHLTSRDNPYRIHKKSLAGTEAVALPSWTPSIAEVEITGRHDYRPAAVPNYDTNDPTKIIFTEGQAVEPGVEYVTVELAGFNDGDPLRHGAGMDYTYTASNNKEVTIDETNGQAIVTVTGVNNFKDQAEGKFSVRKAAPALSHFKFETVPDRVYDGTRQPGIGDEKSIVSTVYGMGEVGDVRYAGSLNQPLDAGPYRVTVNIDEGKNFLPSPNLFLITHNVTKRPPVWSDLQFKDANGAPLYVIADNMTRQEGDLANPVIPPAVLTALQSAIIPTNHVYDGTPKGIYAIPEANLPSSRTGLGAMTILYNGSSTRPRNAGTYTVTLRIAEGRNYAARTFIIGEYKIEPMSLIDASNNRVIEIVTKIDTTVAYVGSAVTPSAARVTVTLPAEYVFLLDGILNDLKLTHTRDFTVTADRNIAVTDEDYLCDAGDVGCTKDSRENREEFWARLIVKGEGNFKDEVYGYFAIELGHPDSSHFNSSVTDFDFTAPTSLTHVYNGLGQGVGTVSIKPDIGMGALKESAINPGTPRVLYGASEDLPVNEGSYAVTVEVDRGDNYRARPSVRLGIYSITRKDPEQKDFVFRMIETKGEGGEPDVYKYVLGSELADVIPTDHIFNGLAQGIVWELADHLAMPVGVEESDDPSAAGRMSGMGTTRNIEYQREGTSAWTTDKPVNAGTYNVRVVTNQGTNFNATPAASAAGLILGTYTIAPRKLNDIYHETAGVGDGLTKATVAVENFIYDGTEKKPDSTQVVVELPSGLVDLSGLPVTPLMYGETNDFTFRVDPIEDVNVNDGDAATVIVTGQNNYTGTVSTTYGITRAALQPAHFTYRGTDVYTGAALGVGDVEAAAGVFGMGVIDQLSIKYYQNDEEVGLPVDVGVYDVKVDVAKGLNYRDTSGFALGTYTVTPKTPALADFMFKNMEETEVVRGEEDEEDGDRVVVHPLVETGHIYKGESQGIGWNLEAYLAMPAGVIEPGDPSAEGRMSGMGTSAIQYELDGSSDWKEGHPTAAGTYNVRINVSTAGSNFTTGIVPLGAYTIDRMSVTITGIKSADKTYDGVRTAVIDTVGSAISGKYEYDDLVIDTVGTSAVFNDKNAGLRDVTFEGFKLSGSAAANYMLTRQPEGVKANITTRALIITPDPGQSKVFGTNDPTPLTYAVSGYVADEDLAIITGNLSRAGGEDVGDYEIKLGTLTLHDNPDNDFLKSNYQLELSSPVVNFEIEKAAHGPIAVTRLVPFSYTSTRTYDISALVSSYTHPDDNLTYTIGTVVNNDGILAPSSVLSAANGVSYNLTPGLTESNVGNTAVIPVTVSGLKNYIPIIVNLTLEITDKTVVEISGVTIDGKVYDGVPVSPNITGLVVWDDEAKSAVTNYIQPLTYTYTGTGGTTYSSPAAPKDAGTYALVVSMSNSDQIYAGFSESIPFTITKRQITPSVSFTGVTGKTFDGNDVITSAVEPQIAFSNAVSGESPVASASYVFVDANAGTNKGVNVSGIALTDIAVNNNYVLSKDTLNSVASGLTISPKNITINTVTPPVKHYDGDFSASAGAVTFTSEVDGYELELDVDYTAAAVYTESFAAGVGDRSYRYTVTMLNTTKANNYNLDPNTEDGENGTINKATALAIVFPTTATPIINGETLANSILGATVSNDYGTFAWTLPEYAPRLEESGSGFEVTFTPDDFHNYDWDAVISFTSNVNVTVNPGIFLRFLNPSHDNSPIPDTAHGEMLTGRQRYNVLVQVLRADGEPLTGMETEITISFFKGGETIEKVMATDPATGIVTYSLVLVSSAEEDIPFRAWMNVAGGAVAEDFARLDVREVVSTAGSDRVIPPGHKVDSGASEPVLELANEITAGPNPVRKDLSSVNLFRQGKQINNATLTVFDAKGNAVSKIKISDKPAGGLPLAPARRIVGSWDLKDSRGRAVPEGTYLIRGAVTTRDGKRETVSLMLGVR